MKKRITLIISSALIFSSNEGIDLAIWKRASQRPDWVQQTERGRREGKTDVYESISKNKYKEIKNKTIK